MQWSFAREHRNRSPLESPVTQERIYLDYAATAALRAEALEAMLPLLRDPSYNPSSLHFEGRCARSVLEGARDRVAAVLGARRKEIVFTSSGSEANSLALRGFANRRPGHLLCSAIEHHSVLRAIDAATERGSTRTMLDVDRNGVVDSAAFEASLRPDTVLASIMYANNEIGVVQPIQRLARVAGARNIAFHTDAVQAAGWLPLDVDELGVTMLTLSAHKFGGPRGAGVLYVRDGTQLAPLVHGGGQEAGRRAGTEDVAAAVGCAVALERAEAERAEASSVAALRDLLEQRVRATVRGTVVNGGDAPRLPNQSSLSFSGVSAEMLAIALDLEGIAVSPGSACTSGVAEHSHVIAALGTVDPRSAVRISLGHATTREQIERVAALLPSVISSLRRGE